MNWTVAGAHEGERGSWVKAPDVSRHCVPAKRSFQPMVTDLTRDWEGREATRLSRKSGNLACCNGSDHVRSGKGQVASKSSSGLLAAIYLNGNLSSLRRPRSSSGRSRAFLFVQERNHDQTNRYDDSDRSRARPRRTRTNHE